MATDDFYVLSKAYKRAGDVQNRGENRPRSVIFGAYSAGGKENGRGSVARMIRSEDPASSTLWVRSGFGLLLKLGEWAAPQQDCCRHGVELAKDRSGAYGVIDGRGRLARRAVARQPDGACPCGSDRGEVLERRHRREQLQEQDQSSDGCFLHSCPLLCQGSANRIPERPLTRIITSRHKVTSSYDEGL